MLLRHLFIALGEPRLLLLVEPGWISMRVGIPTLPTRSARAPVVADPDSPIQSNTMQIQLVARPVLLQHKPHRLPAKSFSISLFDFALRTASVFERP